MNLYIDERSALLTLHAIECFFIIRLFLRLKLREKDFAEFSTMVGVDVSDLKKASELQTSKLAKLNADIEIVATCQAELESKLTQLEHEYEFRANH